MMRNSIGHPIDAPLFRGDARVQLPGNGGDLEVAARVPGRASTRTTQLYSKLSEEISLDEIERIHI